MSNPPLGLKIFWWVEVVASARILFFTLPVLINQARMHDSITSVNDWFIVILTIVSFYYLLIALVSIFGHGLWRLFHYLGVVLVGILTWGLIKMTSQSEVTTNILYLIPLILAIIIAVGLLFTKDKLRSA